jgi:hypothetical protein
MIPTEMISWNSCWTHSSFYLLFSSSPQYVVRTAPRKIEEKKPTHIVMFTKQIKGWLQNCSNLNEIKDLQQSCGQAIWNWLANSIRNVSIVRIARKYLRINLKNIIFSSTFP